MVLLIWLVEHQTPFQMCEMQLAIHTYLHLTNICTVYLLNYQASLNLGFNHLAHLVVTCENIASYLILPEDSCVKLVAVSSDCTTTITSYSQ